MSNVETQTESTVEATKEVARAAQVQASAVATDAREQVSDVAAEAKSQAKNVVHDTKQQLRDQADAQASKVAESLHRLTTEFRALCEGRPEEAGAVRQYAEEASTKLGDIASKVDERGFQGLVEDLQRFARRRPGAFLAGAAATGFLAGRMFRSVKDENDNADAEFAGNGDQTGDNANSSATTLVDLTAPMPSQPVFPAERP